MRGVLLVEDEPVVPLTTERRLRGLGYCVIRTSDCDEAVSELSSNRDISLLLVDLDSGSEIDAPQTVRRILDHRELPVVFLASGSEEPTGDLSANVPCSGYVLKSSDDRVLRSTIEVALELFEARRKAQRSERRFHAIFDNSRAAQWELDVTDALRCISDHLAEHSERTVRAPDSDIGNDSEMTDDIFSRVLPLAVNSAAVDLYGADGRKTLIRTFQQRYTAESRKRLVQDLVSVARGASVASCETTHRTVSGETIPVRSSFSRLPAERDDQVSALVSVDDLREQRRVETALRRESDRLKLAMEIAQTAWWEYREPGAFLSLSDRRAAMLGFAKGQIRTYADFRELLHPEDRGSVAVGMEMHIEGKRDFYDVTYRCRTVSGEYRWYHSVGRVSERDSETGQVTVTGLTRDIHDEVIARQKLERSRERLQYALENSGDGLWDRNDRSGEAYFSPRWKQMLGYRDEEIANRFDEFSGRIHPDDRERFFREDAKHLSGETGEFRAEFRMRCKDGSYRWILSRGKVVSWDNAGTPVRLIGTHTDIHEQKQYQRRIEQLLSERDLLLRELQHRVKNSFMNISGILSLHAQSASGETASEVLETARQRVVSMSSIFTRLFAESSAESNDLWIFLDALAQDVRVGYATDARGIAIRTRGVSLRVSNRVLLGVGMIVNELVTNSLKYAFPDDRRGTGAPPEIGITIEHDGESGVLLHIFDNGIGFEPADPQSEVRTDGSKRAPADGPGDRHSLGQLLVDAWAEQIHATLERIGGAGTHYELRVPDARSSD